MKVKRLIKSFIYLFPIICICVTALGCTLFRLNENYSQLSKEVSGNTTTTYTYNGQFTNDRGNPIYVGLEAFSELCGYDIDSELISSVYSLIENFHLVENDGTLFYFLGDVIVYEMIAIMICAVLDVIFLIPEFYNKLEDKYIKGGKKRE